DFALSSTGASVIPSLTSVTYTRPSTLAGRIVASLTGKGTVAGRSPFTALHYDIHDGHCWPFAGSQGQLGIVLSNLVYIEAITIEHVAATVAVGRRTSAPQDMEVWALVEGQDNITKLRAWCAELAQQGRPARLGLSEYIRIASLRYDIHSPNNIQTFPVDAEIRDIGIDFGLVVLVVKNNWGMEEYTCLYRIRVHG
ncbi:UNC-like C-terminal-domain-containing protein, partial [Mycena leptocephala]